MAVSKYLVVSDVIFVGRFRYINTMSRIQRMFVWLMRIGHCRGFDIQSPTDYNFVCNVVNGHGHRAACADLRRSFADVGQQERKLYELYLRMAKHLQPSCVVDWREGDAAFAAYIHAGCDKAKVVHSVDGCQRVDLLRIDAANNGSRLMEQAIGMMHGSSAMVVEHIKRNREARRFWRNVVADGRVGVTFDLYYVGVAFFDKKRYKQNYIVNF